MGLIRKPDWESCLAAYLAQEVRTPFEMGVSDCALFAAGAVEAMTGVDAAKDFRGKYTTLVGGIRMLKKLGFEDHVALVASILPDTPRAQVGDIAVIAIPGGAALGVVQGSWVAARVSTGIGFVPRSEIVRAFKCG